MNVKEFAELDEARCFSSLIIIHLNGLVVNQSLVLP